MRSLISGLAILLTSAAAPAYAQDLGPTWRTACVGEGLAKASGLELHDVPAADGDLPSIRVTDMASGSFMHVYYQPAYEAVARSRAVCLGGQLGLLREALVDDRREVEWFSVVFAKADYAPPGRGETARWLSPQDIDVDGFVARTMPHEQVHAFQDRAGAVLPRWFQEGHAMWVESKITPVLRPDVAAVETAELNEALHRLEGPAALRNWGDMRVKREAIRRQVSPEMQARMDADPGFSPPGPFSFGPADFESNEGNTVARYAAALGVFVGLETKHGTAAVREWAREVTASESRVSNAAIIGSARDRFGEDIGPLLD